MLVFHKKKPAKVLPYVSQPKVERIYTGDLFDVLPTLDANTLDACVTDPPYGLEFMGKEWDSLNHLDVRQPGDDTFHKSGAGPYDRTTVRHSSSPSYGGSAAKSMQRWHELWAEEVWRVLKPGAYIVVFGGTRTFHRLTCALEDAGFEIRDCLSWMYGTGFPKSKNVALAIDKDSGHPDRGHRIATASRYHPDGTFEPNGELLEAYEAKTAAAKPWEGWGTGLKPAWEPIILARKPLRGTVAENVLKYGTAGLNIDACRLPTEEDLNGGAYAIDGTDRPTYDYWRFKRLGDAGPYVQPEGRWPANVMLDEDAAVQLDAQTGDLGSGSGEVSVSAGTKKDPGWAETKGMNTPGRTNVGIRDFGDFGGASRFFYCAKASRSERDIGCEDLPDATGGEATDREDGTDGLNSPRAGAGRTGGSKNIHPTVKPLKVMRWLVKLVTPPGGIVLDPFLGSGTTAMACVREGFGYIGVEREETYAEIAKRRVEGIRNLMLDKP